MPNHKRLMTLHVSKITFDAPSMEHLLQATNQKVLVEITRESAKELVEHLSQRLEKGMPGTISFQLLAYVEL
jgi:hypothetical protein